MNDDQITCLCGETHPSEPVLNQNELIRIIGVDRAARVIDVLLGHFMIDSLSQSWGNGAAAFSCEAVDSRIEITFDRFGKMDVKHGARK